MSLEIQALNNDTTFLLSFSPSALSPKSEAINVLLDPWLVGPAVTITPAIATLTRPSKAHVTSLKQLDPQPHLICISQSAPDHCHPDTLMTLDKTTSCQILAPATAAAAVKSWKHFEDPHTVVPLTYFDAADPVGSSFVFVPSSDGTDSASAASADSSSSSTDGKGAGMIKVHLIPEPWDLAGMHSIIGITYTPPSCASADPITIVYCPHGAISATVIPYLTTLPSTSRTLLCHSCNQSKGPWFFGSPTYVYGVIQGVQVAKALGARAYIRAHDEDKNPTGVATTGTWVIDVEGLEKCEVVSLAAGKKWRFAA